MPALSAETDGFRSGSFPPTSHRAASFFDREVATWRPRAGSADADLLPELYQLRNRARDIDRNNGVAKGGIQTIVDNVVGSGLRLAARPVYKALGKDKAWSDEWSAKVQAEWQAYAWTTACHAGDSLTFDQLTAQALRSELTNGDALATMLWLPGRGAYATKIQTIESDRLSNPNGEMDSPNLRGGVTLDAYGAPVGYWIRNAHPGDAYMAGMYWTYPQWELIPRYTSFGRLRVLHVFDPQRSGQNRGKPILTSVLSQFKQGDRYVNAEIMAAVVNAMVAGIITTPLSGEDIKDLFDNHREEWLQIRRDHSNIGLQNGGILPLAPGDDFKSHLPQRPAAQFGAFMTNVYRIIACGLDMPYELLLKDFSQTNYSSARAAMLEAWRSFNRRRDWLGTQWCDPIYWNFLEEKVNDGTIDAPGFYENRAAYQRCKWIGPGRGWVDPVKEAMAAQIRIDSGVSTLEDECSEQGKDWEEVMEQRATELARAKELNIPQVVSGRATIVPEDTSNAPGVDTPGAAPPSNPSSGAPGATSSEYRMEVPGEAARRAAAYAEAKAERKVIDVLIERVAALEAAKPSPPNDGGAARA